MIFITVGTELPFDRMLGVIDRWAEENERKDIFAQIGEGALAPKYFESSALLPPDEFTRRFQEAEVIVAHAGMGTILSALRYGKPLIVMPRIAKLGEQRNEHQMATAKRLLELGKVNVAFDENELIAKLDRLDKLKAKDPIGPHAGPNLVQGLRAFFDA